MRRILALALALAALLLAACGESASDDTAPVERAKAFVAATESRDADRIIAFIDPELQRDAGYQIRLGLTRVTALAYRNPTYELKDNDGTIAHVQVSGLVHAELVDAAPIDQQVEQVLTLVKREGEWYIKDAGGMPQFQQQLPTPTGG